MNPRFILFLIIGIDTLILLFKIPELSISYHEAQLLYGNFSFLQLLIKTSLYFFSNNDFALRFPMIILHLLSILLLYEISKKYIKYEKNRIWLVFVFVLLPGIISSAILIDSAGLVIFGLLLFVYVFENYRLRYSYILLSLFLFIDGGFLFLFLGLSLFSIYTKQRNFFLFNILAFFGSLFIYGIDTQGLPQGHFLDSIGIYAAIFTPLIFLYLFYILYRRYLTKEMNILWFISSTALVLSLLLSFRQRIEVEHFAPYLILALPLATQTFYHSYRVRLRIFRAKYRIIFTITLIFLFLNSFLVFFNKELYLVLDEPKKHFAYKMHIAKELARELNKKGIDCISTDHKMSTRLQFYGVTKCNNYLLEENIIKNEKSENVTISYKNRILYFANVTKLNIK